MALRLQPALRALVFRVSDSVFAKTRILSRSPARIVLQGLSLACRRAVGAAELFFGLTRDGRGELRTRLSAKRTHDVPGWRPDASRVLASIFFPSRQVTRLGQLLSAAAPTGVQLSTHTMFFKKFPNSFLGSEAVSVLVKNGLSRTAALETAQKLQDKGVIVCLVSQSGRFAEANVFRFRDDEASPTKAVTRTFLHVSFSDGTEKKLDFDMGNTVRACVKSVAAAVDMTHGIEEWSLGGKNGWLNMDLPVRDQWNRSDGPLRFRKKYFLTDAQMPAQCRERTLLFHQLKWTVINNVMVCTPPQLTRFAALAAQEQLGDFDAQKHTVNDVQQFLPEGARESCSAGALEMWGSGLRGRQRHEAMLEYTQTALKEVPTYGVSRFNVVEANAKDKCKRDLGITQLHLFRIADNQVVETMRLEDLRTWNFTPKSIELEFLPSKREKYVASTTRGREVLALLSEYQYFNRTRGGVSDSVNVHFLVHPGEAPVSKACQVDISKCTRDVIADLFKIMGDQLGNVSPANAAYYSLRSASRWLSADEKLGGLRESELWLEPRTDLHHAAEDGDVSRVKELLATCPINARDSLGNTALHLAVRKEHKLFEVALLMDEKCDVNAKNYKGEPAIDGSLDLSNCGISRAPAVLSKCATLTKRLDLSSNALLTLPLDFAKLKVQQLLLTGNPLPGIPPAVVAGGAEQICPFLANAGTVSQWKRAKLVVCGSADDAQAEVVRALKPKGVRQAARSSMRVSEVVVGASKLELCCYEIGNGSNFGPMEPLFFSRRCVCVVVHSWATINVKRVVEQIRGINTATKGSPPIVLVMTGAVKSSRQGAEEELKTALQPFASQLRPSGGLFLSLPSEEGAASKALATAVETAFGLLDAKEMSVPQSFRSLHDFVSALAPLPSPLALTPGLGSHVVLSAVHDHVARHHRDKPPHLAGVVLIEEFERFALDAFVSAADCDRAVSYLCEIGTVMRAGCWVVLDPSLLAGWINDLMMLQGGPLEGVVPFSVLRALWPGIRTSVFAQVVAVLEALNIVVAYPDKSFLFVPSLVSAHKPAPTLPPAVFVPRYMTEWRFSDGIPLLFRSRLVACVARHMPIEAVWSRGFSVSLDSVVVRVEFLLDPPTKLVLSVSSKKPILSPDLGQWVEMVVAQVVTLLEDVSSLKAERFVRALSMQKPALIRYGDLLEFQRKGNKIVAIQGVNVNLEQLLPPPSKEMVAFPDSQPANSWVRAATARPLVLGIVLCAEVHVLLADVQSAASGSKQYIVERAVDLSISRTLERFSLQTAPRIAGYEGCRDSLIERVRFLTSAVASGAPWQLQPLAEARQRIAELVGALQAADLGTPLDEPSCQLLRSVGSKFASACGASARQGGSKGAESKNQTLIGRVANLQLLVNLVNTVEGASLLEAACGSLHELVAGADVGVSSAALVSFQHVTSARSVAQEALSGRAAVLPLSRLPQIAKGINSDFCAFLEGSRKAYHVEQALVQISTGSADLAPILEPVVSGIALQPSQTLFSRISALKETSRLANNGAAGSLYAAGGGDLVAVADSAKLALAEVVALANLALESSDVQFVALSDRLNASITAVLAQLGKSDDQMRTVVLAQRVTWNELLDGCRKISGLSQLSHKAVEKAARALADLWKLCSEENASIRAGYARLNDSLKNTLLEVRMGLAGNKSLQSKGWPQVKAALEEALQKAGRSALLEGCVKVCEAAQDHCGSGDKAEEIMTRSVRLSEVVGALDVCLFEMAFSVTSIEALGLRQQAVFVLQELNGLVEGLSVSFAVPTKPVPSSNEKGSNFSHKLTSVVALLRLLHLAAKRALASRTQKNAAIVSEIAAKLFGGLSRLDGKQSAVVAATSELESALKRFGKADASATTGQEVLRAIVLVRNAVTDVKSLQECGLVLESSWGSVMASPATADDAQESNDNAAETTRRLEIAVGEMGYAATRQPAVFSAKVLALVQAVARVVDGARTTPGPVRRCYAAYAPVFAAARGRCNAALKFTAQSDGVLALADAVSLLCEGLENAAPNGDDVSAGRKGMMAVRDALGAYAEAESQTSATFAKAAKALDLALSNVGAVKGDYKRVGAVVETGHAVQKLLTAAGALLFNFESLELQRKFSKARNRLVAVLQDLVGEVKRATLKDSANASVDAASGTASPARTPPQSPRDDSAALSRSPRDVPVSPSSPIVRPLALDASKSPRGSSFSRATESKSPRGSPRPNEPSTRPKEPVLQPTPAPTAKSPRSADKPKTDDRPKSPRFTATAPVVAAEPQKSPRDKPDVVARPEQPAKSPRAELAVNASSPESSLLSSPPTRRLDSPVVDRRGSVARSRSSGVMAAPSRCKAVFKYAAKSAEELSFQRGDEIELDPATDASVAGVWRGRIVGSDGPFLLFNSKYIKLV